jgi:hypothetical protein
MAIALYAGTLEQVQHTTRLNPESRITYFKYRPPNMTRITVLICLINEKSLIGETSQTNKMNYFAEPVI